MLWKKGEASFTLYVGITPIGMALPIGERWSARNLLSGERADVQSRQEAKRWVQDSLIELFSGWTLVLQGVVYGHEDVD